MPRRTGPFVIAALLASSAFADDVVFSDFSDTTGLQINGIAGVVNTSDGDVMRLTPSAGNRAGSVFSDTLVNAMDFSTRFQFRITDPGGAVFDNNTESGADGFVFVVQPIDSSLGSAGQGIGYSGIGTSLGVEFDTWGNNGNNDPSQSHVGVNLNESVNHNSGLPTADVSGPELDDGDLWSAWIDYDGTNLEVRLSADGLRPTDALISYDLDLVNVLGQDTAYVGFTSATGAAWANHDIVNWSYAGFTPIPAPASVPVLMAGLLGLSTRRRR
jgi:hypothetical protein